MSIIKLQYYFISRKKMSWSRGREQMQQKYIFDGIKKEKMLRQELDYLHSIYIFRIYCARQYDDKQRQFTYRLNYQSLVGIKLQQKKINNKFKAKRYHYLLDNCDQKYLKYQKSIKNRQSTQISDEIKRQKEKRKSTPIKTPSAIKQTASIQTQTDLQPQNIKIIQVPANRYQKLLCGDVLFDEQYEKQFLTETIENLLGKTIKNTKLLYRYDPLNSTNIHKYIDNHEYFILLAKLTNQYLIAFISEGSLVKKDIEKKRAWIVSLTNRKLYPVLNGKKALSYDQQYLIVGNNEIRVSSLSNKLLSNFGISNNYYDNKQDSVNDFLGNGDQRQTEFETLQIFKIFFE